MAGRDPGGEKNEPFAPRISFGHFFLAIFFRVTHDGLSETGTTRSISTHSPNTYESVHEGSLNDAINYAHKGCTMQMTMRGIKGNLKIVVYQNTLEKQQRDNNNP